MKGMSKILRGYTFKSVLLYCEGRGDKDATDGRLIGGNMAGRNIPELMAEFLATRKQRPDIEKTTWHNSLRLPPGDEILDEKWDVVASDYMAEMGFSPLHPYCVWKHDDESAIHIIASRISMDGSVYLGKNENLASTLIIQKLELQHNLQITKGPKYAENDKLVMPEIRKLRKNEIEQAVRTEVEAPRQKLQRLIDEAAADQPTASQFAERLDAAGVTVIANLATTGTMNGFSFSVDGVPFKGSQLGKSYAWKGLLDRGITYEQARDCEELKRFSATARANKDGGSTPNNAGISVQSALTEQQRDAGSDQSVGIGIGSSVHIQGDSVQRIDEGFEENDPVLASSSARNASREQAADARLGSADRADRSGVGPDPSEAAAAGRAPGQARGGDEPGDDRPALAGVQRRSPSAVPAGQQGGPGGLAVEGLGGEAGDVRQVLSADHKKKIDAWRRQAAALGAPTYRLSLIGRSGQAEGKRINLGKQRDDGDAEHFFDAAAVEALIPQLRRRNALGFDVYVTPIDKAHHYIVIDDMKPGAVQLLSGLAHAPCLVQSSSKGNEQAVLKVPRIDRSDEQALANKVVQQMNMTHGDPKFSGVVHPFRMAGFSNKKPGRESAFTRILEASHRICNRAADLLQQLRQAADSLVQRARKKREQEQIDFDRGDDSEREFRRAAAGVRAWVRLRGLTEDASRVDFHAAVAMLGAGWSEAQVRAGMISGSDDLAVRHTNPDDYVRRTVSKASIDLATSQASTASAPPRPRVGG